MNETSMQHVVFEGLPAVGKSEALALLARFYPERIRVLPELVKEVVTREKIDLFSERERLTKAILAEIPRRKEEVEAILAKGQLCLEESHLGVHLAYAHALNDRSFIDAYHTVKDALPAPDLYLRLEIPIGLSLARQRARGTAAFDIDRPILNRMLAYLQGWHVTQGSQIMTIDADRSPSTFLTEIEQLLGLSYTAGSANLDNTFDLLFLLGRPASGKSEFIDFMEKCPLERRAEHYHIAPFSVIDDFPTLWEKFKEDDLWESLGRGRLYSKRADENYAVVDQGMWPFLTGMIDRQIAHILAKPDALSQRSLFVEFSRGGESGYKDALNWFSKKILFRTAILYVNVSAEESWRRNLTRYDENKRDGILTHSVPREEMKTTYGNDDWPKIASSPQGTLNVKGIEVPYVTMGNEPESTDPDILGPRYKVALDRLHRLWKESRS
jgi:thymidylate kinase